MNGLRIGVGVFTILVALTTRAQDYGETITVERHIFVARVTSAGGSAIDDLTEKDFLVTIGGRPAVTESVTWIGRESRLASTPQTPQTLTEAVEVKPPPGRLIVFLMHTDFGRASGRVRGQLHFNGVADRIVELFEPEDRVAVLSHDSHVKLRVDFTGDKEAIRKAIRDSIHIERLELPEPPESGPSIARYLETSRMRRAANGETALLLISEALSKIEGDKLIIVAGWGFGELWNGRVMLPPEWGEAVGHLQRIHVPTIALNTGLGGELSAGLIATAKSTGGFYAFPQEFPQQSVTRVAGMLAGYYELVLRLDTALEPGWHPITIRPKRRGATVYAPPMLLVNGS